MISIDDFFYDDPKITPQYPWRPLPKHSLEQSPCYPIIGMHNKYRVPMYLTCGTIALYNSNNMNNTNRWRDT